MDEKCVIKINWVMIYMKTVTVSKRNLKKKENELKAVVVLFEYSRYAKKRAKHWWCIPSALTFE